MGKRNFWLLQGWSRGLAWQVTMGRGMLEWGLLQLMAKPLRRCKVLPSAGGLSTTPSAIRTLYLPVVFPVPSPDLQCWLVLTRSPGICVGQVLPTYLPGSSLSAVKQTMFMFEGSVGWTSDMSALDSCTCAKAYHAGKPQEK